ncbi:MAG: TraR/DksA C4-type zinc finger protein [Desulfobacterales bacterium]|nr:TraR/DksA C4-type zinc finger protein [Desulfobacterales bacterium]
MDDCDLGRMNAALFLDLALDRARQGQSSGQSLAECVDCGEAIPEKRRRAVPGCRRCVACQTDFEIEKEM